MISEKTIETAREALRQVKGFIESETGESGDIIAWHKLKNFVDLVEASIKPAEKKKQYVIVFDDEDGVVFWVTRCGDTDNYSLERSEAARFADRNAASALIRALKLGEDHFVLEF